MARYLFCAWPYAGHLHPSLALAEKLAARGHVAAFYTGRAGASAVEEAGFPVLAFDALDRYLAGLVSPMVEGSNLYRALNERYTTAGDSGPLAKWSRVQRLFLEMTAGSIEAQLEDLRRYISEWRPDVLITDAMLWAPFVVLSEKERIPVVPFSFYAGCLIPGRRLPVAGLGIPPATSWSSGLRNRVVDSILRQANSPVRRLVNGIRRREGLAPIDSVPQHSGRMPLYVVTSSPAFDYLRDDLPESVVYAGPCLWEPESPAADPSFDAEPPVVYVSEGTAQVGEAFLIRTAIEALADENVQVVVTTGRHRTADALRLGALPHNVRIFPWLSHRRLFERTAAVVTTGGSSTVRQALACGVPVLAVPLEWDQLENAQRLITSGAGIGLPRARCTVAAVRAAVRDLLSKPSFRAHARRIGQSFDALADSAGAIGRLEELAREGAAVSNAEGIPA